MSVDGGTTTVQIPESMATLAAVQVTLTLAPTLAPELTLAAVQVTLTLAPTLVPELTLAAAQVDDPAG